MVFSVVVPTHHRPGPLGRLLDSLAAQTLDASQFEVIVVPSPDDQSLEWLAKAHYPFSLVVHQPQPDPYSGKSASFKRNEGVHRAQADWIAFIDDDCEADPLWLATALPRTQKYDVFGIEGCTEIPVPEKKTLTYKGLQRLSAQGGYQTCNMFYRKATFLEVGGFDLNFPFYLEDTDLAWSFLDRGKNIVFLENAIVRHPVPPPEVKRVLSNALRVRLVPYLYKKHRDLFDTSDVRAINPSQWMYLGFYVGILYSVAMSSYKLETFVFLFGLLLLFNLAYLVRLLHDCSFTALEALQLFVYIPIAPLIAFFQLMRGNIENRTFILY